MVTWPRANRPVGGPVWFTFKHTYNIDYSRNHLHQPDSHCGLYFFIKSAPSSAFCPHIYIIVRVEKVPFLCWLLTLKLFKSSGSLLTVSTWFTQKNVRTFASLKGEMCNIRRLWRRNSDRKWLRFTLLPLSPYVPLPSLPASYSVQCTVSLCTLSKKEESTQRGRALNRSICWLILIITMC